MVLFQTKITENMDPKTLHRLPVQLNNQSNTYTNINAQKFFYSQDGQTFQGRPLISKTFDTSENSKFSGTILKIDQDSRKILGEVELDKIVEYEYQNWSKGKKVEYLERAGLEKVCGKLERISECLLWKNLQKKILKNFFRSKWTAS